MSPPSPTTSERLDSVGTLGPTGPPVLLTGPEAFRARRRALLGLAGAALAAFAALAVLGTGAALDGPDAAAAAGAGAGQAATGTGRAGVPRLRHVFVVVMENLDAAEALATPDIARLAERWATATSYYSVAHPSLPNYLALTSGGTWGITSDCTSCYVNGPNLFSELPAAHESFGAYMEGIPSPCYLDPYGGVDYAGKHDPFRYYEDVRSSPSLCAHILPYSRLAPLLAGPARAVPRFVWVTPNLCDDGHDCPPATAGAWLARFVGEVTGSAAWRDGGALFVTWDESNGIDSAVVPPGRIVPSGGGGPVLTIVVAPGVPRGRRVGLPYNHYSLLATVEDALDLPLLGAARAARPMAAFFSPRPRGHPSRVEQAAGVGPRLRLAGTSASGRRPGRIGRTAGVPASTPVGGP